jgi:hypothetical protein
MLEEEVYHIINYFPHWFWAWMLILALAAQVGRK